MSIKQSTKERSHVTHVERDVETKDYRQLWTEHKIVLIAYEAQFMYGKKPYQPNKPERKSKREVCMVERLKYETSFVLMNMLPTTNVEAKKYLQQRRGEYRNLVKLVESNKEQLEDLKQLLQIMLEIKHIGIVDEFALLYQLIVGDIIEREYNFDEEQDRRHWETLILNKFMQTMDELGKQGKFSSFRRLMSEDAESFKKLIMVQAYCFLAERFNFNINEYYCDAFELVSEDCPSKMFKKDKPWQ